MMPMFQSEGGHTLVNIQAINSVGFSPFTRFGKKPAGSNAAPGSPSLPDKRPASPEPARPARRIGGVSPFFSNDGPLPERLSGRKKALEEPAEDMGEAGMLRVTTLDDLDGLVPDLPGEQGPMTQAAFTQLPSDLDLNAALRRPVPPNMKEIPEALEDCALSYANGQAKEALVRLDRAIARGGPSVLGSWSLQAWLMRFDLYEQLGMRAAFEEHALAFAAVFDRPAPTWPSDERATPVAVNAKLPSVNIKGILSSASAAPLSALRKTVERYSGIQLDFGQLQSADADGCRYLLVTLQSLKRAGKVVVLSNEEHLLLQVRRHIQPGDAASDATAWLLLLEVLQYQGREEEFRATARDYASTYSVAAPLWQEAQEAGKPMRATAESALMDEPQRSNDWFVVDAEVVAPADRLFNALELHAARNQLLVIDMSRTRRIDFISSSQLANVLTKIQQGGRAIEIRSPNEMVSTLLVLMGAAEVARIVPRR